MFVNGKPFTVLKTLGKGGSSVVYLAFDESERILTAIKKVDLSDADEAQAQGYLNEITMLKRLQGSEKIVKMYDYEYRKDADLLFVVMEEGDTDLSKLKKEISSNPAKRKSYWIDMLEAVQVIHKERIIHSDLKPANFLLVKGNLKLIDFGIASAVQSDKTSVVKDSQMGTFNFMSPEAIEDLSTDDDKPRIKISEKSDIWSLGCILYHLTYGELPFGKIRMPIKKLEAIINPKHEIEYPDQGHDPDLVDTIKKCLIRDVNKRASVEELLNHPYVTGSNSENKNPNTDDLLSKLSLSQLSDVLTPNTRRGLSRALENLRNRQNEHD